VLFIGFLDRIVDDKVSNLLLIHIRFYLMKISKRINGKIFGWALPG
jgi:hypothetical protein